MKKTFKEVAHLYLGCEVVSTAGKHMGIMVGVDLTQAVINPKDEFNPKTTLVEYLKPILHRLEDMTDECCLEVSIILRASTAYSDISKIAQVREIFRRAKNMQTNILMCEWFDLFVFLLSKHYDLFNLIDNGQAIDAKTYTNEK